GQATIPFQPQSFPGLGNWRPLPLELDLTPQGGTIVGVKADPGTAPDPKRDLGPALQGYVDHSFRIGNQLNYTPKYPSFAGPKVNALLGKVPSISYFEENACREI